MNKLLKRGTKIKVISGNASGVPAGEGTIMSGGSNGYYNIRLKGDTRNWSIYSGEFTASATTKEEIRKEITQLDKEAKDLNAKLEWMDEAGVEEYDEDEFKVWKALSTLNSKKTKMDKVKILAKLLKS